MPIQRPPHPTFSIAAGKSLFCVDSNDENYRTFNLGTRIIIKLFKKYTDVIFDCFI